MQSLVLLSALYRSRENFALSHRTIIGALAPKYLVDKLTKRSSIHARHTRKRDLLHISLYRTASGQRTFAYRGTSIWNNDIKQCVSLQSFKQAIKGQLLVKRARLFTGVFFTNSYFLIYLLFITK